MPFSEALAKITRTDGHKRVASGADSIRRLGPRKAMGALRRFPSGTALERPRLRQYCRYNFDEAKRTLAFTSRGDTRRFVCTASFSGLFRPERRDRSHRDLKTFADAALKLTRCCVGTVECVRSSLEVHIGRHFARYADAAANRHRPSEGVTSMLPCEVDLWPRWIEFRSKCAGRN